MKSYPKIAQAAHLLAKYSAKSLQEQHILLVFSFLKRFDVLLAEAATWTKCFWNDFLAWLQYGIHHVSAGIWIASK